MDSSEWNKERKFEIEKINPIWMITTLCVAPLGIYFLLSFLSPLIHKLTAMRISEVGQAFDIKGSMLSTRQIYVYPIKSLRAVKVTEAVATKIGFKHDSTSLFANNRRLSTNQNQRDVHAPAKEG